MNEQLRRLRIERGLSQESVAACIGVTTAFVGQLERGEKRPSLDTARRLALFFGITIDELVNSQEGAANVEPA